MRARTYEPYLGRWLTFDPTGFADGSNLYQAYFIPNSDDPSGEIKRINENEHSTGQACTGEKYGQKFDWELDNDSNKAGGYIVQHIKVTCVVQACDPCLPCPSSQKTQTTNFSFIIGLFATSFIGTSADVIHRCSGRHCCRGQIGMSLRKIGAASSRQPEICYAASR